MIGTRERIVRATSLLLQRHGYEGTGIKQIAGEAGAALGSLYHFFPGGKQELAVAAIRHGEQEFAESLRAALDCEADAADAVVACTTFIAAGLRDSGWVAGCAFSATALGTADRAPEIRQAAAEAIECWQGLVAGKLRDGGLADADARDLACTVINLLEGGAVACQIAMDDRPLRLAGQHLARLVVAYRP